MDTDGHIIDEEHGLDFDNMKDLAVKMYTSMVQGRQTQIFIVGSSL